MLIIIYDRVQESDAADALKSPALSNIYTTLTAFDITMPADITINAIGIGNTDATTLDIDTLSGLNETITIDGNGLYELPSTTDDVFSISHNGTYIGRIALGLSRSLGVAPTREAGFYTTQENRVTLAGQIIPGAGGHTGKRISVDLRYKIDSDVFDDFENAIEYVGKGYPYFLKFTTLELVNKPFERLYASPNDSNLLLQSSVNRFLYSKQFDFFERF